MAEDFHLQYHIDKRPRSVRCLVTESVVAPPRLYHVPLLRCYRGGMLGSSDVHPCGDTQEIPPLFVPFCCIQIRVDPLPIVGQNLSNIFGVWKLLFESGHYRNGAGILGLDLNFGVFDEVPITRRQIFGIKKLLPILRFRHLHPAYVQSFVHSSRDCGAGGICSSCCRSFPNESFMPSSVSFTSWAEIIAMSDAKEGRPSPFCTPRSFFMSDRMLIQCSGPISNFN